MEMEEIITEIIEKRQLFCRMNDTCTQKMVYEWKVEGRRHGGWQPTSLKQGIHQIMKNLDITAADAKDRDRQKTIISGRRQLLCFWLEKNLCSEGKSLCSFTLLAWIKQTKCLAPYNEHVYLPSSPCLMHLSEVNILQCLLFCFYWCLIPYSLMKKTNNIHLERESTEIWITQK